jgi:release factor glutamine methyltransferase
MPEQYRDGSAEFCGLRFACDKRALIPRFETEFLVKETVRWCAKSGLEHGWRIADIGTGSGIIAASIAQMLPRASIVAGDASHDALELARENASVHKVADRISFVQGDLLDPFIEFNPEIIVANLPYIPSRRIRTLDASVRDWEPKQALDGGEDGFELYRKLFDQIASLDKTLRFMAIEIDDDLAGLADREIQNRFPIAKSELRRDSSGYWRYVTVEFPNGFVV